MHDIVCKMFAHKCLRVCVCLCVFVFAHMCLLGFVCVTELVLQIILVLKSFAESHTV